MYFAINSFHFAFQISTSVLQVTSVTVVRLVIIQMDLILASVIADIQGMDEPVEVLVFDKKKKKRKKKRKEKRNEEKKRKKI